MTFEDSLKLEVLKLGFSFILLLITWLIGQKIIAYWDYKRKAREVDISVSSQFQQLFGEYKEIWRLWKACNGKGGNVQNPMLAPISNVEDVRWKLLIQASAAEGRVEGVLIKLATERTLSDSEINLLGLFRQAFQQLRHGIRDSIPMNLDYIDPEYKLLNELGCKTTYIVLESKSHKRPSSEVAYQAFDRILNVRREDWLDAVEKKKVKLKQH